MTVEKIYYYSFENTRNLANCIHIPESSQGEIEYLNNTHGNNIIIRRLSFLTSIVYVSCLLCTIINKSTINIENRKTINKKKK